MEAKKDDSKVEKDPADKEVLSKAKKATHVKKTVAKKPVLPGKEDKPKEDVINKEYMKVLMDMGFNEKLSKAALEKVENQGVTEAVEVAIKLQGEPEYQEAAPPKAATKVAQKAWKCPQCTFENQPGKSICDMCQAEAPPEALVNEEEEKAK